MSRVVRITDKADKFIRNRQRDGETTKEAIDRLLGVGEKPDYVTEGRVQELIEQKIEEMKHRH